MDILKRKSYNSYNYLNRYSSMPYYYNTVDAREIYGTGKQMSKNNSYVLHKIAQTDTLDYLALKYYNNPTYWWVIAYFNDIQNPFLKLSEYYETIMIPNITGIAFTGDR